MSKPPSQGRVVSALAITVAHQFMMRDQFWQPRTMNSLFDQIGGTVASREPRLYAPDPMGSPAAGRVRRRLEVCIDCCCRRAPIVIESDLELVGECRGHDGGGERSEHGGLHLLTDGPFPSMATQCLRASGTKSTRWMSYDENCRGTWFRDFLTGSSLLMRQPGEHRVTVNSDDATGADMTIAEPCGTMNDRRIWMGRVT